MPREPSEPMTETELRSIVETMLVKSEWMDSAERQQNMADAIDAYLGRKQRVSIPGEIDMRSEDVADTIEAVTAQIMPAFHFDELAQWEPHGKLDVDQASLESKICNSFIFDFNDGDVEIQQAIKDGLLLRNSILRVYLDEEITVSFEEHEELSDLELLEVQQPTAPVQEVEVQDLDFDKKSETSSVKLKRTTHHRRLDVSSTDPVNFIIEKEYEAIDPADALIVGERRFVIRGDLVATGYSIDLVASIPRTETDTRMASLARNRHRVTPIFQYGDWSLEHVELFELYIKIDFDGDGVAERRRVIYAGGTSGGVILENDPHPFVPYAVGVPFIYPHRHQGISLYDKLHTLEDQKSDVLTQWANNMENSNFPELVVADGEVAEADYTSRKAGGVMRADRVEAVREIMVRDIGGSSGHFLEYLDKVRAERGGSALDMQSAAMQIASDSAHGMERMYSTREQLSTMICNTLADTMVKQLFKLVHKGLKEWFPGEHDFHVGAGQFVSADPSTWPGRSKVRVTAGMSFAERQQKRAALESHLLQQEKLWTSGYDGVLVDFDTYYSTLIDWSKAAGLQSPRRHWVDPKSDGAKQALQQKQQTAQAQAARDAQLQRDLVELQVLVADRDNQADLVKKIIDVRQKYWSDTLNSEMEELRIQAQGSEDADPDPEQIDADQEEGRRKAEGVTV